MEVTSAIQTLQEGLAPRAFLVSAALAELEHLSVHLLSLDPDLETDSAQGLSMMLSDLHLPSGSSKPGTVSLARTLSTIAWTPSSFLR